MKTTRIEIEGPNGTATLHREDRRIVITGTRLTRVVERRDGQGVPVGEAFELVGRADNHQANVVVARMLQKYLDGHRGTEGDVAEYLRVIETFAD
jgi:hypothetical protein